MHHGRKPHKKELLQSFRAEIRGSSDFRKLRWKLPYFLRYYLIFHLYFWFQWLQEEHSQQQGQCRSCFNCNRREEIQLQMLSTKVSHHTLIFWGVKYCNKSFGIVNTVLCIDCGVVVCYCNEATDWFFCRPAMLHAATLFPSIIGLYNISQLGLVRVYMYAV